MDYHSKWQCCGRTDVCEKARQNYNRVSIRVNDTSYFSPLLFPTRSEICNYRWWIFRKRVCSDCSNTSTSKEPWRQFASWSILITETRISLLPSIFVIMSIPRNSTLMSRIPYRNLLKQNPLSVPPPPLSPIKLWTRTATQHHPPPKLVWAWIPPVPPYPTLQHNSRVGEQRINNNSA